MQAKDVMTTGVITVAPETTVREIAGTLAEKGISAVPVVDGEGAILGIVSEGDLMRRQEIGTESKKRSWWLWSFSDAENAAVDYAKSHGTHARDIMTKNVASVAEQTPLGKVAEILESKRIKRVPVVRDGKLVGIVSRANIVQAIAAAPEDTHSPVSADDEALRKQVLANLEAESWNRPWNNSVVVRNGVVSLYGTVRTTAERDASRIAVENTAGVGKVNDHRGLETYSVGGI